MYYLYGAHGRIRTDVRVLPQHGFADRCLDHLGDMGSVYSSLETESGGLGTPASLPSLSNK